MEFPNPLLEPVEEIRGELYIPGNRALINLNLTGKIFYSFMKVCTSTQFKTYIFFVYKANKIGDAGMKSLLDAVQYQSQLSVALSKNVLVGLLRLSLKVNQDMII